MFYEGFLSDMWIISRVTEDFPKNFGKVRNNTLAYNYAQDALVGGSGQLNPLHPNYVACFIPYKENEQQKIAPAGPTPGQINKNFDDGSSIGKKNFSPFISLLFFTCIRVKVSTHYLKMDKRKP